jgi:hypothetical protein
MERKLPERRNRSSAFVADPIAMPADKPNFGCGYAALEPWP